MYRRFLNDSDYLGVITEDALMQMTRANSERFIQAEESAEMSLIEYLSENYEVERELNIGKFIAAYDRCITFPVGAHFYLDGRIHEVIRSISGYKAPSEIDYWEEYLGPEPETLPPYSQFETYYPGDVVLYNMVQYRCLSENGMKFMNIRIPMVCGWLEAQTEKWQPIDYQLWDVVSFEGGFYTLTTLDGYDNNIDPLQSENWGAVADYDPSYNDYELSDHEYVVYHGRVFYPETDVNADQPVLNVNYTPHDPRNYNLKKHMVRLAIYELTKLIAPNNVSIVRLRDYEDSMKWLADAAKLRLNPQIPRKIAADKKETLDWQLGSFQTDINPYKNQWLT